jgi:hypothetical protein
VWLQPAFQSTPTDCNEGKRNIKAILTRARVRFSPPCVLCTFGGTMWISDRYIDNEYRVNLIRQHLDAPSDGVRRLPSVITAPHSKSDAVQALTVSLQYTSPCSSLHPLASVLRALPTLNKKCSSAADCIWGRRWKLCHNVVQNPISFVP